MSTLKHTLDIYGTFIKDAWQHTLRQTKLLPLAFLTIFAFSGLIFMQLMNLASNLPIFASYGLQMTAFFHPLSWVILNLGFASSSINAAGIALGFLASLALFVLGVIAQQMMITSIKYRGDRAHGFKDFLRMHDRGHLKALLLLNAVAILGNIVLFFTAGFLLSKFILLGGLVATLGTLAIYLTFLPLFFFWQATVFLALIRTATHGTHALNAISLSYAEVIKHPLPAIEVSLMIFGVHLAIAVSFMIASFVTAILIIPFVLLIGQVFGFMSFMVFMSMFVIAYIVVTFTVLALSVSFSYHAWYAFAEHLHHSGIIPMIKYFFEDIRGVFRRS